MNVLFKVSVRAILCFSIQGVCSLDIDSETLKPFLVEIWQKNYRESGLRDLSGGQTRVFAHPSYPKLIFKTASDEALRERAQGAAQMAALVKELGFDKVVVPDFVLIEVSSSTLNKTKLYLIEEKFDITVEPFESEYIYNDYYRRFKAEPGLKEHFSTMFLQLTELSARLPGLWDAKHNNMPLEKTGAFPRMVLVDFDALGKPASERLEFLFKGTKFEAIAHPDFFDDMYGKAIALVPHFNLGYLFHKFKAKQERHLTTTLAFTEFLEKKRQTPDAEIGKDSLDAVDLTDTERKTALGWIDILNKQIQHVKKFDGNEFTKHSAPILRITSRERKCSRSDNVLRKLKEAAIIFSFDRVTYDDEKDDNANCFYTIRW